MNQPSSSDSSRHAAIALTALAASLALPVAASDSTVGTWDWSLRYRLEVVDDDRFTEDAEASTLRARLGYRSAEHAGFYFRLQGEGVAHVGLDDFNDTRNGRREFPVVADPDGVNLNEAYVGHRGRSHRLALGRQALNFDNQRFIGSVAWRQNEQTYDSLLWEYEGLDDTTITYGYIDAVRRIFGPDSGSPTQKFDSDSHILHLKRDLPIGRLSTYAYLLEFANAPALSTRTFGARLTGKLWQAEAASLGYQVEAAHQSDFENNPDDFQANYYLAELSGRGSAWSGSLGIEVLAGDETANGQRGFVTPLATLHKFQGLADLFLATPGFGVVDGYVRAQYQRGRFSLSVVYHDFESDLGNLDLGTEIDVTARYGLGDWGALLVQYARFDAEDFGQDRSILWLQYLLAGEW